MQPHISQRISNRRLKFYSLGCLANKLAKTDSMMSYFDPWFYQLWHDIPIIKDLDSNREDRADKNREDGQD